MTQISKVNGTIIVSLWGVLWSIKQELSTSRKRTCLLQKAYNRYIHTTNRKHLTSAVDSQCLWTPNVPVPINRTWNSPQKSSESRGSRRRSWTSTNWKWQRKSRISRKKRRVKSSQGDRFYVAQKETDQLSQEYLRLRTIRGKIVRIRWMGSMSRIFIGMIRLSVDPGRQLKMRSFRSYEPCFMNKTSKQIHSRLESNQNISQWFILFFPIFLDHFALLYIIIYMKSLWILT